MTKLLLVDDDTELANMLREYLEREDFSVTLAHDGEAGAAAALSGDYALAVLDVMMPKASGMDALSRIRAASDMPVIMLTAKGDDIDRIIGLEMGADDYVQKPCTPRELVARIRAVLRRFQTRESADDIPAQIRVGPLTLWPARRAAQWGEAPLTLTSTEFNLLQVLARNAGKAVSKPDLSEQAMGRPLSRFDRSIDVHMSSIRHKLGLREDGRTWIQTVRGIGYQLTRE
ncbi:MULTISPECIES: response regulator transcription factor [Azospira]|jgi:two-component system OmpR family response regulator|uniref:Response regulator with CheY-like receiver domain and winged-helix DNA-binding domain n=1 Tax=Azospira oryzae (strain ATCC BAA-33 / DSM 13638 / PS) TaxID=640081 RepID=G8QGU2_AZOOP|nr:MULTISPECIES: response regulator transcription factor [Azospira]TLS16984.1 MAG: response regulator transcription factor [Betaproteobacteria bacterium]AEV26228.1 response regulator with CheY-like receiver domain and winged-helix DNA-binding domain [Azospira oryzae PS]MBP7489242.1 response regulator transcription factor [Azospira sp.]MDK9689940.1 response regulator transcription factor [Azospira sp.]BBN87023.1 DNA-binding response regulator [Azospira sp. I09]